MESNYAMWFNTYTWKNKHVWLRRWNPLVVNLICELFLLYWSTNRKHKLFFVVSCPVTCQSISIFFFFVLNTKVVSFSTIWLLTIYLYQFKRPMLLECFRYWNSVFYSSNLGFYNMIPFDQTNKYLSIHKIYVPI